MAGHNQKILQTSMAERGPMNIGLEKTGQGLKSGVKQGADFGKREKRKRGGKRERKE